MRCMSCNKLIMPLKAKLWKEGEIEYAVCRKCYKLKQEQEK